MLLRLVLALADPMQRRRLSRVARLLGAAPVALRRPETLWDRLTRGDFDLVLVDAAALPPQPDSFIASIRELPERPEVIVVAAKEDASRRARLLAAHCLAVLWSGLPDAELQDAMRALLDRRREEGLRHRLSGLDPGPSLDDFVSHSPAMQRFLEVVRRVSTSDSALLALGETGVGKERMARAVHAAGPRASGPFLAVNCAALSESLLESELFGHEEGAFTGATRPRRGFFELAHRGTIFLDEIGEMPLHLQVKLLRVLEERRVLRVGGERPVPVDVRIMAATNRDLEAEMKAGRFRADLFYRLAVVTLHLPPLRDRREDIPELARSYLAHFRSRLPSPVQEIRPEAMEALVRYPWPGNVRELINTIECGVLLSTGPSLGLMDLPRRISGEAMTQRADQLGLAVALSDETLLERPLRDAKREIVAELERRYLSRVLAECRGRIGHAARRAGITERSLYDLMRRHRLRKESFREAPAGDRSSASDRTRRDAPPSPGALPRTEDRP